MELSKGVFVVVEWRKTLLVQLMVMLSWNLTVTSSWTRPSSLQLLDRVFPARVTCQQMQNELQKNTNNTHLLLCPPSYIQQEEQEDSYIFFLLRSRTRRLHLQLKLSGTFLAPNFRTAEMVGDLYSQSMRDDGVRECFYEGNLVGDMKTKVTMNICQGLRGAILSPSEDLFIAPGPGTRRTEGEHLLYLPHVAKKPSKQNAHTCATPESKTSHSRKVIHDYKMVVNASGAVELVNMKNRHSRMRRAMSVKRYIETMVVTDESMFEFYGRNEIELRRYILSVMAIVGSVMKDRSIGNFVEVAVIKLVILKKNPPALKVFGSADATLRRFCKWQNQQNKKEDSDPEHFDTAILLTRSDLCSTSCDTLGLAELGTACDPFRSCSIVEDNGLSSAFTIAHELGHLLNAPHDGDNNECDERSGKVHLMTPTFNQKSETWTWSSCSRKYITTFLESTRASCLLDKPSPKFEHPLPLKLPGERFTLKEQCQLVYGSNSTFCNAYGSCERLWCIQYKDGKKTCQSNNMPWADGTKCGNGSRKSWCIRGKCRKKQRLNPIHGQWGSWSGYSECSRTCGGGVKMAKRKCNKPKPANNGNYCIGNRHKYKSCNVQTCPPSKLSFRAVQCRAFNGRDLDIPDVGPGIKWLPKMEETEEGQCKLFCEMKGKKGIYHELLPKVIDGTKCRRDSTDVCVDGRCRNAGCDNVLGSSATVDNCGVCNGDNSTCRTYIGYKNSTIYGGYNFVATIPRQSSQVNVRKESCKRGTWLALLNHDKRYILNGHWTVSLGHRRYTYGGATIFYSGARPENETIRIPSTLATAMEIQVLSTEVQQKCNIRYSYNFPISGKQKYRWVIRKTWSQCYPMCKGYQLKEYDCRRDLDSQVVAASKCVGRMPEPRYRSCNQHCELRWTVYASECVSMQACGSGVQEQKVECLLEYKEKTQEPKVVPHKECHSAKVGKKPAREVPCYSPCSTVRWIYSSWSKCNQTCGGGTQFRKAWCFMQVGNKTVPSTKCKEKSKGLLEKPCSTHQCPKWFVGAWPNDCSVTCGEGRMSRLVYCTLRGAKVNENQCNGTKPATTRHCVMGSCASWKYNAWSRCSVPCGDGYSTRMVYCERANGEKVSDHECGSYKPKNRKRCYIEPCVLWASLIYMRNVKWVTKKWGACSKSCGGGYRERVVQCISNKEVVSEDNCNAATKPTRKQRCRTMSCPFWRHGAWSSCTRSCGTGSQTRLVLCGWNGTIVSDDLCLNQHKPYEKRKCNAHKCRRKRLSREWTAHSWSQCSTTCGHGLKHRNVTCNRQHCSAVTKPVTVDQCNLGVCPVWNYGQWTPCYTDNGCGDGWQARLVVCQLVSGKVLSDKACGASERPEDKRYCSLQPCQDIHEWKLSPWQPCSVPCGTGHRSRDVYCEDKSGNKVPDAKCEQPKPSEKQPCTRDPCPKWSSTEWSQCDSTCNQRREVMCMQGEERIDDTLCSLDLKLPEERECESENCIRQPLVRWRTEAWGACASTCGYSLRSRRVLCQNGRGVTLPNSRCRHLGRRPKTREWCVKGACPPPKWTAGPWTKCSRSCGRGHQVRRIYCRSVTGGVMKDSKCMKSKKSSLPSRRVCNQRSCGRKGYKWKTRDWERCSLTCGIGETVRKVLCVDGRNRTVSHSKCDETSRPGNMKVCNMHPCPSGSCRQLQHSYGVNRDGEHTLVFGNKSLLVFCEGMHRNNPKEYITLRADPKENFSEVYGKRLRKWRTCPNAGNRQMPCVNCVDYRASGVTFFNKVRIDVKRMVLIPEDRTFSERYGRNPPAFASAGDCYSSAKCPQGRFIVNLKETGLKVHQDVTWNTMGFNTSKKIYKSRDGQIIHGKCGGNCGMCAPSKKYGLKVEVVDR